MGSEGTGSPDQQKVANSSGFWDPATCDIWGPGRGGSGYWRLLLRGCNRKTLVLFWRPGRREGVLDMVVTPVISLQSHAPSCTTHEAFSNYSLSIKIQESYPDKYMNDQRSCRKAASGCRCLHLQSKKAKNLSKSHSITSRVSLYVIGPPKPLLVS